MIDIKLIIEQRDMVEKALLKRMKKEDLNLNEIIKVYEEKQELLKSMKRREQSRKFQR